MDRGRDMRPSHHSFAPTSPMQDSFGPQASGYDDLDPDYEGEQFYASVQRLIDHFQNLDTNKQEENELRQSGYVSEDMIGYEPSSHDLDRSRVNRRATNNGYGGHGNSQFYSVNDISSQVERGYSTDGDFVDYHETGHFRRGLPDRQSTSGLPSNSRTDGYFGVRLSQRKPRPTPTHVDLDRTPTRDSQTLPPQNFQRSYSLGRNPTRNSSIRSSFRSPDRTLAPRSSFRQEHSNEFRPRASVSSSQIHAANDVVGRSNGVDYVSEPVVYQEPFRRNRFSPVRSRPVGRAQSIQHRTNASHGTGDSVVLNELRKRYPTHKYDVKRVSSRVTPPQLNGYDTAPQLTASRDKSHDRLERNNSGKHTVLKKGLLKKGSDKFVDIVQYSSPDSDELNSRHEPKIVRAKNGEKYLELTVDVSGFKPNDIQIITQGKLLQVVARGTILKNSNSEQGATRVYRELKRQFSLPEVANAEHLQGVLNGSGVLSIHGPIGVNDTIGRKRKSKKVKFVFD